MFTDQEKAFILKAHFRSAVRQEDGSWKYSLQCCREQFDEEFPDNGFTYKQFAQQRDRIVNQFENKNCICKGKSSGRPTILTEERVEDVRQHIGGHIEQDL
jgi:hypothetical protein